MAETEEEPGIKVQIEHAVRSRLQHFKDQADALTLESVRRLLEKDMGLEKFALDAFKRFIRQYLEKQMDDADNCDSKTTSDVDKDNHLSDKEAALLPKQPETKKESTKFTPDDKEIMEDSPILGVLSPKSESGVQAFSLSESTIKKAIWERAHHFLSNSETITLVGVRRLLEEDLELDKNTLDPFKKYISQQIDQVLNPPKRSKTAKDVKINSKSTRSKKSRKTSSEEGSDTWGGESASMEDKVKSRKEAAHRKNKKLEEVKKKRKRSTEGDFDVSSTKQNKLAKRQKEEDNESDDAGNVSEDGESKVSLEKPRKEKPVPGYGRKVEHLKSVIKACGMSVAPSIYKKAKHVSDEKREAFIVKELEGVLLREGLSKDPNEKEIKDCKKRKETAKELEGIDMSNIISSTRRRSTFSFASPPKFETRAKGDKVGPKVIKNKEQIKKDQNDDNKEEGENKKEQEEVEEKERDEQTFEEEEDEEDEEVEDDDDEEAEEEEGSEEFNGDDLWQMNPRSREQMEPGSYPVHEDEPDCSYYIRTGLCRFEATCRFNHPPDQNLVIATARMRGEYPERIGQPDCQYYLKTATCKFGSTCKFNHPRDRAGIAGRVALNALGYPLRPNEIECAYFMRNGHCKFGSTCKFHHPQQSNMMVSLRGSSVYTPIHSPTTDQLSFPLSRASFIPSSRWQNPSIYTPMVVPQGVVSVPGWNLYTSQLGSLSPSENQRPTARSSLADGVPPQGKAVNAGSQFRLDTLQLGQYAFQRDNVFPERLGQPECQFYMKTGDCKFGAVCKFHHPRERFVPVPDCVLSPLGLPIRPGEPICVFYSRYGICKFGPSCKFDHPMRAFAYNTAASSSTDSPAVRRFSASTGAVALSLAPDGFVEARQKSSGDNNIDSE